MFNKKQILFNNLNNCKKICRKKKNNCKLKLEILDPLGNNIIFKLNNFRIKLSSGDYLDINDTAIELNEFAFVKLSSGPQTGLIILYNNGSQVNIYNPNYTNNFDCLKLINIIFGESSWFGNIYKNNKLKKRNTFIFSPP